MRGVVSASESLSGESAGILASCNNPAHLESACVENTGEIPSVESGEPASKCLKRARNSEGNGFGATGNKLSPSSARRLALVGPRCVSSLRLNSLSCRRLKLRGEWMKQGCCIPPPYRLGWGVDGGKQGRVRL